MITADMQVALGAGGRLLGSAEYPRVGWKGWWQYAGLSVDRDCAGKICSAVWRAADGREMPVSKTAAQALTRSTVYVDAAGVHLPALGRSADWHLARMAKALKRNTGLSAQAQIFNANGTCACSGRYACACACCAAR